MTAFGLTAQVQAQESRVKDWSYRAEVFGLFGNGRLYNGDNLWGSGLEYGGGIGVRPFSGWMKRIGFEFEGAHFKSSRTTRSISVFQNQTMDVSTFRNLDSRLLQGSVLYHFRSGTRMQPFGSIGIGRLNANYSFECVNCIFDVQPGTGALIPRESKSEYRGGKTGITFGGGLKFAINRHLSVRSQAQWVGMSAGSGINLDALRFQLGLGVHF